MCDPAVGLSLDVHSLSEEWVKLDEHPVYVSVGGDLSIDEQLESARIGINRICRAALSSRLA